MFQYGRIVDINTFEKLVDFGNDGFRCIKPIKVRDNESRERNLLICGMEHLNLEIWEVKGLEERPVTCQLLESHKLL
jgi:hypothetical protein